MITNSNTLRCIKKTTWDRGVYNIIKLGILLVIVIVGISGIVILLPREDNSLANNGKDSTQNYVFDEGELFEDFDNIHEWTADGIGASQETDTLNVMQGNQSLKLTGTDGNIVFTTKTVNINVSDATNIIFWLYVHDKTSLNDITLYLSPSDDWSTFFSRNIPAYTLVKEWNRIVITKPQFSVVGEASWDSPIVLLRVRVQPNEGMNAKR